tara:strand:- start:548 stop:841 length:294 start_codon:yes stop_codon:yes gene_type:complete
MSIDKLKKRFNILILITIIIFLGRNINRINNEIEVYSYKPLKEVNYRINKNYFDISNLIKSKIMNYELCKKDKSKCNEKGKIRIKKIFNNYILYVEK